MRRPGKRLSLLVYGLGLIFCYLASTLYHGVRWPTDRIVAFARLDGVGIFALIAGTYTPIAVVHYARPMEAMDSGSRLGRGDDGHRSDCGGPRFSPLLATCVYLGMGWGAVVCYWELAQLVSYLALVPVLVGGLFYSVGAVLNLLRWPALWPGTFGPHELFHLFVLAGSLAHYLFILEVVVPFVHRPPEDLDETMDLKRLLRTDP